MPVRIWRVWLAAFRREPWWCEFWSAVAALGISLWTITAPHGSMAARPALRVAFDIAGPAFWEVSGIALFSAQLVALVANHRLARWGLCLVGSWYWGTITLSIYAADPGAFLLPCAAVMFAINLFSVARLLRVYPA